MDASIIGSPPHVPDRTRIYASGAEANQLLQLRQYGLDVRVLGSEIGQASGLKMCYAALTKGLTAIGTELFIAADRLNLSEPLWDGVFHSQTLLLHILAASLSEDHLESHRSSRLSRKVCPVYAVR